MNKSGGKQGKSNGSKYNELANIDFGDEKFQNEESGKGRKDRREKKEQQGKDKEKQKVEAEYNAESHEENERGENEEEYELDGEESIKDVNGEEDYDMLGDDYLDVSENGVDKAIEGENIEDFRHRLKRSGVVYLSYIPPGMNSNFIRKKFTKYGVNRIHLVPEKSGEDFGEASHKKKKIIHYKEGWAEFKDKIQAKFCEFELNGQAIGGKRHKDEFFESLWSIKYLKKFKWHNLMEKLNMNKKLREQRMKSELSQAKRESNFLVEKFEQSKMINKMKKKREKEIMNELKLAETQDGGNEVGNEPSEKPAKKQRKEEKVRTKYSNDDAESNDEEREALKEKFTKMLKGEKLKTKNLKIDSLIDQYENKNTVKRNYSQKKPIKETQ